VFNRISINMIKNEVLMIVNNRYLIKTENGYQEFIGINKVKSHKGLAIIFDNCYLVCTCNHLIKVDGKFVRADSLKPGDTIGSHEILDIYPCTSTFYDVVGVRGNTYSCNGFEHHNCSVVVVDETAFIKQSLWNDFIDAVAPTQSALSWKKNIYLSTANGMNHFYELCTKAQQKKVFSHLPSDTQIELDDGTIVDLDTYYKEHYGNNI